MRFSSRMLALAAGLLIITSSALAQDSDRPMRFVVPYPPGGGTDILARLVGGHIKDSLKRGVIVDNRVGGNSLIGMEIVARAAPDGRTFLAVGSPLDAHNLKYFAPVALFAAPPYLFVVHPSVKAGSVKELIALAKAQPGKLNYGSTGGGATSHLATELFNAMAGVDILHVPYKGIGAALTDLLGGHVMMMIGPTPSLIAHVQSGRLRAVGITSNTRSTILPSVPTISESGVKGYEAYGWFGLMAPARTPKAVTAALNSEINRILVLPDMKARLAELGAEPVAYTPDEFLAFIKRDNIKWDKLIAERTIEVERRKLNL